MVVSVTGRQFKPVMLFHVADILHLILYLSKLVTFAKKKKTPVDTVWGHNSSRLYFEDYMTQKYIMLAKYRVCTVEASDTHSFTVSIVF